jgi:hypothetical protein
MAGVRAAVADLTLGRGGAGAGRRARRARGGGGARGRGAQLAAVVAVPALVAEHLVVAVPSSPRWWWRWSAG